jgi:hypothetical protein
MKKFLEIYLGFFIALPIVFCIIVYLIGCFISWSIISVNIHWGIVRVYICLAIIITLFLANDEK